MHMPFSGATSIIQCLNAPRHDNPSELVVFPLTWDHSSTITPNIQQLKGLTGWSCERACFNAEMIAHRPVPSTWVDTSGKLPRRFGAFTQAHNKSTATYSTTRTVLGVTVYNDTSSQRFTKQCDHRALHRRVFSRNGARYRAMPPQPSPFLYSPTQSWRQEGWGRRSHTVTSITSRGCTTNVTCTPAVYPTLTWRASAT